MLNRPGGTQDGLHASCTSYIQPDYIQPEGTAHKSNSTEKN